MVNELTEGTLIYRVSQKKPKPLTSPTIEI